MIHRKTTKEIASMQEGGRRLGAIRDELMEFASPGISLLDIEKKANELIAKSGGTSSFKTVPGYHHSTCLCVNDVVVHGIPTKYVLKDGDIVTIDIGLIYEGFHTDAAWTKIVGNDTSPEAQEKRRFLEAGEKALTAAIALAKVGNRIGDISESTQAIIEGAGYSIVKTLVGHGVGRDLHEDPQVPNYTRGDKKNTYQFQGGETIAIEPIYAQGAGQVVYANDDGWTLATKDGSWAAVFEHSLAVIPEGTIVLTRSQN